MAVLFLVSVAVGALITENGGRVPLSPDQVASASGVLEFSWSPDSKQIAYVSAISGSSEVWVVPSTGGSTRRITSSGEPKANPRWSPDGKWIAYVADRPGRSGDIHAVDSERGSVAALLESMEDDREPQWSPDSKRIAFQRSAAGRRTLNILDVESRQVERLVDEPASEHQWSPDGEWIAFVSDPLGPSDNRRDNEDIFVISANGGTARLLTPGTQRYRDHSPSWSPDSRRLAFLSESTGFDNVYSMTTDGGERRPVASANVDFMSPKWSPDGNSFAFIRNEDFRLHVFVTPGQSGRTVRVSDKDGINGGVESGDGGPRGAYAWSPDGKRIAYTHAAPGRAPDLWVVNADGTQPRQLTNSMPPELRRDSRFVWPEALKYRSFDGEEIGALVYRPKGSKPKEGHPAVLLFRDTLDGQHTMSWDPFAQFLATNGYLVFAPNVRGSGGQGKDFRQSVYQHGGDQDVRDAFIGLDRLSADGLLDTERVGVLGSGTGAFLAAAAIIRDEARFRAAASLYGIVDATTAFTYPGLESWARYLVGASPMANPRAYYERSLVNFVGKLRTPIVFFYAGNDPMAPPQQLNQFAVSAEVNGKWFDYHVFADEPHGWHRWKPSSLRSALEGTHALFDRFLLGRDREIKLSRGR